MKIRISSSENFQIRTDRDASSISSERKIQNFPGQNHDYRERFESTKLFLYFLQLAENFASRQETRNKGK